MHAKKAQSYDHWLGLKQAQTLQESYTHTLTHKHKHIQYSCTDSRASLLAVPSSACVALSAARWGDSGCSVERLAPLQRLSRTFHLETAGWQAGWLLVNKPNNKQQHRLYIIPTERKKNPFWKGINPCHIIPVISDNSASICEHKKRLDYAISGELLCWFYYSIWDNFTGISAHFTVANHKHCNECYACCNVKTLLFSAGFSL